MTTRQVHDSVPGWAHALRSSVSQLAARTSHYDTDAAIAATLAAVPIASDLGTSVTLGVALEVAWAAHVASTAVHAEADATNVTTEATPTNLATLEAFIIELKTVANAHFVSTTYHRVTPDLQITSADPSTDQTAANTLANELQEKLCKHFLSGMQTLPTPLMPGAV